MRFGIEIEFLSNGKTKAQIAAAIRRTGARCRVEGHNHCTRSHWKVITDGSCDLELVSPPLEGDRGLAEAKKVLRALERTGAKINRSCGFHVHHDASQLSLQDFKNIFKNWIAHEDIFDAFLPLSRRGNTNQYCQSLLGREVNIDRATTVAELYKEVAYNSRYYKLNLGSYFRHGTIEFRHHSGTVEWCKVLNWVQLTHHFLQYAIAHPTVVQGSFLERFNSIFQGQGMPTQMKAQKQLVYSLLGVDNTKAVKIWSKQKGLNIDLRTKAGWQTILENLAPQLSNSSPNNLIDLRQFYVDRMRQLNTIQLLGAA